MAKSKVDQAIEAADTTSTVYEDAGVHVGETMDKYDALYVDPKLKAEVEGRGGKLHWASERQINRHKNNGMKPVERKEGDDWMVDQSSREDSRVRTGDLTLMEVPGRLKEKREAMKKQAVADHLYARKEEMERRQEGAAKSVYDAALRKGLSRDQAQNLARSAAKGLGDSRLDVRRGR
jgi:hypothetical protein